MYRRAKRDLFLSFAALACSGCSFVADFDSLRGPPDGGPDGTPLACAVGALAEDVPANESTAGREDEWSSSCGGSGAPDIAYEFTSPATAYYRFTTTGSAIDTTLMLAEGDCDGRAELACNDDSGESPTSEIVHGLAEGERVLVVVDGDLAEGATQVLAERITCPAVDVPASTVVSHTTVGRPDEHSGACGGVSGGDRAYRFAAPNAGYFAFRATKVGDAPRHAIYVEEGPECGGRLLQCSRGEHGVAEVTRYLAEGEVVTVWVDAIDGTTNGAYDFTIVPVAASCPDSAALDFNDIYTGTLASDGAHAFSSSCVPPAVWWFGRTDPAEIHYFPERRIAFQTVENPAGCANWCELTVDARFPFAASIQNGVACAGFEEGCFEGIPDETAPETEWHWKASIPVETTPEGTDTTRVLLLERLIGDRQGGGSWSEGYVADDFTLQLLCAIVC